ncbi:hypothetical protein XENTR_v10021649 [Xenopus tropicalis]|nr:hypothetical protein XENTR_v10021649 [Xenopus tropicalis]
MPPLEYSLLIFGLKVCYYPLLRKQVFNNIWHYQTLHSQYFKKSTFHFFPVCQIDKKLLFLGKLKPG